MKLSECLTEIRHQYTPHDDLSIEIIVFPTKDGEWVWQVRSGGGKDESGVADYLPAAINAAREWCEGPEPWWATFQIEGVKGPRS